MYLFLVLKSVVGPFLGFIQWMLLPIFHVLFKSSSALSFSRGVQILIAIPIIGFLIAVIYAMHEYSL